MMSSTSRKEKKTRKTSINGQKIPDLAQHCYNLIAECRDYKDTLIPRWSSGQSSYPMYLLDLEDWALGDKKLPDWAITPGTDDGDIASSENQIWTVLQTIKSAIDEKDFQLNYKTEGEEDNPDIVNLINAVRKYEWRMNKMSKFFKKNMYKSMWHGTTFFAILQWFFDSEPDGRQKIIELDNLAVHWDYRAKRWEECTWWEFSFLAPIPEIEYELQTELDDPTLNNEDKYDTTEHRLKHGSTVTPRTRSSKTEGMARLHYMYFYDTSIETISDPVMDTVEVDQLEDIEIPLTDENGDPIDLEAAGANRDDLINTEVVEPVPGMTTLRGQAKVTDDEGNPVKMTIEKPRLDDEGNPVVKKSYERKYPNGRLVIFNNNQIIRDVPNPDELQFFRYGASDIRLPVPIVHITANEVPNRPLGVSHIEMALDMQHEINIANVQIRENARLAGNNPTKIEAGSVVYPRIDNYEDFDFSSHGFFIMKKGHMNGIEKIKQESLPQHHIMRRESAVQALYDSMGINEMLVRGIAHATDPAKKTEWLTHLALRRAIPFFTNATDAMTMTEEIMVSLYRSWNQLPKNINVKPEGQEQGQEQQNVLFDPLILDNLQAQAEIRIENNSETRREQQTSQLARFIEQAGATLSVNPVLPIALTKLLLDRADIPGLPGALQWAAKMLGGGAQQGAEGQEQQAGTGEADNVVDINAG